MLAQRLEQRRTFVGHGLVERQAPSDDEARDPHQHAEDEGYAPAPGNDLVERQDIKDESADGRAEEDAAGRADDRPGAGGAASIWLGGFGKEDGRTRIFAA